MHCFITAFIFYIDVFVYVAFIPIKQIVDPHTVDVDGKLYSARHILVSVGGRPFIPEIPGSEYAIDSDAALDLPSKPEKIAIVGGGYIALEFAGIFNGLTSEVHVFIRQKKVLRGFDEEVGEHEESFYFLLHFQEYLFPFAQLDLFYCRLEISLQNRCLLEELSSTLKNPPKLSLNLLMVHCL